MAKRQRNVLPMEDSQVTTVRLHKELWQWVRIEALHRELTMVDLISQILTAYRDKTETRRAQAHASATAAA